MKYTLVLLFLSLLFFNGCIAPMRSYEDYDHPAPPDYSHEDSWVCLPTKHNASDTVPPGSGAVDMQATAPVDVFFIYPTLYFGPGNWNADIHNKHLNKRIESTTIRSQASVFKGSCKIYSPRYRQATLYAFVDKTNGTKALNLAYQDIRNAFKYYMQHYNNGRPIIIAGHSQGTLMAYNLVKEFFDTTALKKQLVAAYLVGYEVRKDSIKHLCPCDSANATGCYITWNTFGWNADSHSAIANFFRGVSVNPLSWKQDTNFIDASHNLGSVGFGFKKIDKNLVGAANRNGLLHITNPGDGYRTFRFGYHIYDYSFFYMNIRQNVEERVREYLKQN